MGREIERLLEAVKLSRNEIRDRCLVLLMFRHGLRVSEACGLVLEQVHRGSGRSPDRGQLAPTSTPRSVPGWRSGPASTPGVDRQGRAVRGGLQQDQGPVQLDREGGLNPGEAPATLLENLRDGTMRTRRACPLSTQLGYKGQSEERSGGGYCDLHPESSIWPTPWPEPREGIRKALLSERK